MMYVESKALVPMDEIALKAAVEPMLMSERREVKTNVIRTAFRGMFQPGLTLPTNLAKGKPPSRANDQVWRETVARVLMTEDVTLMMMTAIMTDVPP